VTLPWAREYAFNEAYAKRRYDTAALTQIAASIGSNATTREQYFTFASSGAPKGTASSLAQWQGYWCGLTNMAGSKFVSCWCNSGGQ
jgi:hypothetical protein